MSLCTILLYLSFNIVTSLYEPLHVLHIVLMVYAYFTSHIMQITHMLCTQNGIGNQYQIHNVSRCFTYEFSCLRRVALWAYVYREHKCLRSAFGSTKIIITGSNMLFYTAGTPSCVVIDNETHESGVNKCTTGEACVFACPTFSDTTLVCFIVNEHTTTCYWFYHTC